ncbi:MAG: hypothetical protein J6X49_00330 [Victivallales bacterium]|nr:hypothetical protein [Victivallales bacterium]
MSKCLTSIQLLRAMVEPTAPENAAIMAHLYACDKCLNELREWQEGLENAEYIPQPGDDEAAANAVKSVLEQHSAWKRFWNTCQNFLSGFRSFSTLGAMQPVFAGARHHPPQIRTVTQQPVFHFDSRHDSDTPRIYEWHAVMTLPMSATPASDIRIDIVFPSLPQGASVPEKLSFQGKVLTIEDGKTTITCKEFYDSIRTEDTKRKNGEIYVDFVLDNGQPKRVYGDPKP